MRNTLLGLMLFAVVGAACGDAAGDAETTPPAPTVLTTTTTVPVATTAMPDTTQAPDTSAAPTTTAAPEPSTTTTPLVPLDELNVSFVPIASGFSQPVFVTAAPGDPRLFVVDQPGLIWTIDGSDTAPFLDINERVTFGGERGLLGLAFHPGYESNRRFFVNYVDNDGDTVVAEFTADGATADAGSERILLTASQPASNHNGGMIAFGPDGYLWIGLGDGGGADDRFGQGQRPDTLLAAMLRIDVDGGDPYAVPADNPFVGGTDGAAEVWAYGLRNPWRWSFDGERLFIGDVGQNRWEELSVASVGDGGLNYGWPIMEGTHCFRRSDCDQAGLVLPVIEYGHDVGCSITGGYVYRGGEIPELAGHYFYGDYCGGWVNGALIEGAGTVAEVREWAERGSLPSLTSFGVDAAGEMYATTADGRVWRLQRG
jgi:glucose/arabinose dehydrogenase